MRLKELKKHISWQAVAKPILVSVATAALVTYVTLYFFGLTTSAANNPVSYTIIPSAGSVQPNGTVNIVLSVKTDINLAGGSVNLTYSNGAYLGFQTAKSEALSFVNYYPQQNDVAFICNNNNCAPGTYEIATINVRAGGAGVMSVVFTPKETADPQLRLVGADGTTGTYNITSTSTPPSETPPASNPSTSTGTDSGAVPRNIFTIPQNDGQGGTTPLQVTDEEFEEQNERAGAIILDSGSTPPTLTNDDTTLSPTNLVLIGGGAFTGIAIGLIFLLKFIAKRSVVDSSINSSGPGPTIFPS